MPNLNITLTSSGVYIYEECTFAKNTVAERLMKDIYDILRLTANFSLTPAMSVG